MSPTPALTWTTRSVHDVNGPLSWTAPGGFRIRYVPPLDWDSGFWIATHDGTCTTPAHEPDRAVCPAVVDIKRADGTRRFRGSVHETREAAEEACEAVVARLRHAPGHAAPAPPPAPDYDAEDQDAALEGYPF